MSLLILGSLVHILSMTKKSKPESNVRHCTTLAITKFRYIIIFTCAMKHKDLASTLPPDKLNFFPQCTQFGVYDYVWMGFTEIK